MHGETDGRLVHALLTLKTPEEMTAFFEDLCTIQELKSMTQRLEVAQYLEKKLTYAQISEITGASTATISRVNRSLVYGADGYKLALDRMSRQQQEEELK